MILLNLFFIFNEATTSSNSVLNCFLFVYVWNQAYWASEENLWHTKHFSLSFDINDVQRHAMKKTNNIKQKIPHSQTHKMAG